MIFLMSGDGFLQFMVIVYLVLHSPAIITLIIALAMLKNKPQVAKKLLIFSGIYFLVGGGICGMLFI